MDTPIPTVPVVQLVQRAPDQFVWIYTADKSDYSVTFPTADAAKLWLFTPVAIEPTGAPEVP